MTWQCRHDVLYGFIHKSIKTTDHRFRDTWSYDLAISAWRSIWFYFTSIGNNNDCGTGSIPQSYVDRLGSWYQRQKPNIVIGMKVVIMIGFLACVVYSFTVRFGDEGSIRLLVCTVVGLSLISWKRFKRSKFSWTHCRLKPTCNTRSWNKQRKIAQWYVYLFY